MTSAIATAISSTYGSKISPTPQNNTNNTEIPTTTVVYKPRISPSPTPSIAEIIGIKNIQQSLNEFCESSDGSSFFDHLKKQFTMEDADQFILDNTIIPKDIEGFKEEISKAKLKLENSLSNNPNFPEDKKSGISLEISLLNDINKALSGDKDICDYLKEKKGETTVKNAEEIQGEHNAIKTKDAIVIGAGTAATIVALLGCAYYGKKYMDNRRAQENPAIQNQPDSEIGGIARGDARQPSAHFSIRSSSDTPRLQNHLQQLV